MDRLRESNPAEPNAIKIYLPVYPPIRLGSPVMSPSTSKKRQVKRIPPTQYQNKMIAVGMPFRARVETAKNPMKIPAESAKAKPSKLLRLSALDSSSAPAASPPASSLVDSILLSLLLCQAIMMTAEKQIIIATISTMKTRSLKMQKAKIEIQNGLVCQHTITSEIGASGAARFSNTKLIWPVMLLPR
eukprot:CAMPEP_0170478226 /NCGR_PEP_ID=MMETSP0123-20130129/19309_1 /TAXON_ID=182087 /ORGANISM="Favella ehrenbergii, Strain Fehren 1" /LENGTH=187 /DNA_ID=CAMNT_0010750389 /DNA_START=222 /DNA_END=785 /DNA_ORIENTATION=-